MVAPLILIARALAPVAALWSRRRQARILHRGIPLPAEALAFARILGIERPEDIRVEVADEVPLPIPRSMARAARAAGFPVMAAGGMCLGRGICALSLDPRLLRHELVHTLQYQRLGGHRAFMRRYLEECLVFGYAAAPMEIEARERSADPV
ncbi:hypothetical protein [Haloferula sargassicola]|uniref:DUF4157 domain-containing protein n=1 Tax=Haloferula sargassicola TaxID=490096 RepID=A0ABP9UN67_9BACT